MRVKAVKVGNFKKIEGLFSRARNTDHRKTLEKYGKLGVEALENATPVDTGITAVSWGYQIIEGENGFELVWTNSNVVDGWANVAILIQYGHGTGTGGYVEGVDYINPALRSVFEGISDDIRREVGL